MMIDAEIELTAAGHGTSHQGGERSICLGLIRNESGPSSDVVSLKSRERARNAVTEAPHRSYLGSDMQQWNQPCSALSLSLCPLMLTDGRARLADHRITIEWLDLASEALPRIGHPSPPSGEVTSRSRLMDR